ACLPLPLGEGRGEGIVRRFRNNLPGFSPLLKRGHQSILQRRRCCDETLNGLRAEARSHVVVVVCAQALTPTLSQRERESYCTTTENTNASVRTPQACFNHPIGFAKSTPEACVPGHELTGRRSDLTMCANEFRSNCPI